MEKLKYCEPSADGVHALYAVEISREGSPQIIDF